MLLLRARETAMSHFRPILQSYGITEQQWRALRALHEQGELKAAGLAAECAILAPSMTRIIRRLAGERLVLVNRSKDDKRELRLRISAKGRRLVDRMGPEIERAYDEIRDQMESSHMAALYRELGRFIDRVEAGSPAVSGSD